MLLYYNFLHRTLFYASSINVHIRLQNKLLLLIFELIECFKNIFRGGDANFKCSYLEKTIDTGLPGGQDMVEIWNYFNQIFQYLISQ